jgi:hypothetical protein
MHMTTGPEFTAFSDRVHKVYDMWAPGHTKENLLTLRSYDPGDFYQRVDVAFFPAEPDLELSERFGRAGMGEPAYQKLGDGFDDKHVLELVHHWHAQGKNTVIPTLHLKDVLDTALTHNRLFTLSGGDPEVAEINDVILNPMISHLDIAGEAVMKVLTASGNAVPGLPVEGAITNGMTAEDAQYLERFYGSALSKRLGNDRRPGQGTAIHWSLTGTRGVDIVTVDGEKAMSVNRVKSGVADILVKRTVVAVPVPMDVRVGDCKAEVLEPRSLETIEDVHMMMEEMVEAVSDFSGQKIYYGVPEGAEVIAPPVV